MKPYKLDLSQFGEKLRDKINFTISNVSDEKIDLTIVSYASKFFEITMPSSVDAGKTISCSLKLNKDILKQNFEKSFTIETSDSKKTRFTVPVKRQVRSSTQADTKTVKRGK